MNKHNKKMIGILAALVAVAWCSWFTVQNPDFVSKIGEVVTESPPDPLEVKLNDAALRYQNGDISIINISSLTTFSWDRLYIFGDYVETSRLDSIVGRSWRSNDNCNDPVNYVSYSDSYTLLVFSNQGVVIHCLAYEKYPYYLYYPIKGWDKSGYSPEEALFVISDTGRMVLKENK